MPLGICVWADRGSLGMVVMYFKSADQAKAEFTTIRGQVEQQLLIRTRPGPRPPSGGRGPVLSEARRPAAASRQPLPGPKYFALALSVTSGNT